MKPLIAAAAIGVVAPLFATAAVAAFNYGPYDTVAKGCRPYEQGQFAIRGYWDHLVDRRTLVLDVREVSSKATFAQVELCLWQVADAYKEADVDEIVLARDGRARVRVDGQGFRRAALSFVAAGPWDFLAEVADAGVNADTGQGYPFDFRRNLKTAETSWLAGTAARVDQMTQDLERGRRLITDWTGIEPERQQ